MCVQNQAKYAYPYSTYNMSVHITCNKVQTNCFHSRRRRRYRLQAVKPLNLMKSITLYHI